MAWWGGKIEKAKSYRLSSSLNVALEGFEPSLKVPETCVLPLHHKAVSLSLSTAKVMRFWLLHQIFPHVFSIYFFIP